MAAGMKSRRRQPGPIMNVWHHYACWARPGTAVPPRRIATGGRAPRVMIMVSAPRALMIVLLLGIHVVQHGATQAATLESIKTGPLVVTEVVVGSRAELPCDVSTADPTDRVILVLWYKDGIGTPIF
ncbi:unnamed protein product, partial [Meganyctiphanes norvegica]